MSLTLRELERKAKKINRTRDQLLALHPDIKYEDGRTLQSHKDETDIVKIMARFAKTGTISHLAKNEGQYADFSDYDFFGHTQKLTRGREMFDELPAELRKEFHQSPAEFFEYVNDPSNKPDLRNKLPALAAPGQQNKAAAPNDADTAAALAAQDAPASTNPPKADPPPTAAPLPEK